MNDEQDQPQDEGTAATQDNPPATTDIIAVMDDAADETENDGEASSDEPTLQGARRLLAEHPVATIATAAAVGAVMACVLPRATRPLRRAAPKKLSALAAAASETAHRARQALPLDKAEHLAEQVTEAARKANAATAELARAGLHNVQTLAAETAKRADIEGRAHQLADSASDATAGLSELLKRGLDRLSKR